MRMEEGSPEKAEIEKKEEALKSKVAIRCAKAAFLLSSLRSLPNSTADHHHQVNNLSLSLSLYFSLFGNVLNFNCEIVTDRKRKCWS